MAIQNLRKNGQQACVVICTDGESTDGDIIHTMRPLKELPVWVIIRLCTDDSAVVDYWNDTARQLGIKIDVLDDLKGEAEEVYNRNNWLTYAEPLHRLREFGIGLKEFESLDDEAFSLGQIRRMCSLMYVYVINHLFFFILELKVCNSQIWRRY